MSPADWARAARGATYQQKTEDQQAINIIESLLLDRDTPSDAARVVADLYNSSILSSDHQAVSIFWSILSNAARTLGGDQPHAERLSDLIIAIYNLPDVTDTSNSIVKNPSGRVYWRGLPGWATVFREYGIAIDGPGDFPENEWPWQEQVEPLLNATTFAATLLNRAPFACGMEFYACEAFSCALRTAGNDTEENQQAELYLPAAATWVLLAGRKIREACVSRASTGHVLSLVPERWDEWQRQFDVISASHKFGSDSREWAARAAAQMRAVHPVEQSK